MISAPFAAADEIARSGNTRVALLELYSSEGCSSCPPAEEWLSKLASNPDLFKKFVPVVFHVDYWDYLGWKDIFSQERFSARQRNYAQSWNSSSVYTPGFVLNGLEWRQWSRQPPALPAPSGSAGDLKIEQVSSGRFKMIYQPLSGKGPDSSGKLFLHAALLQSGIVSNVKAGENAGRRLAHDFAVVDFVESGMELRKDGFFEKEIMLKFPSKDLVGNGVKQWAVAAWVTRGLDPAPIQAAGGYLSYPGMAAQGSG